MPVNTSGKRYWATAVWTVFLCAVWWSIGDDGTTGMEGLSGAGSLFGLFWYAVMLVGLPWMAFFVLWRGVVDWSARDSRSAQCWYVSVPILLTVLVPSAVVLGWPIQLGRNDTVAGTALLWEPFGCLVIGLSFLPIVVFSRRSVRGGW